MPLRSGPASTRPPSRRDPADGRVRTTALDLPRPWENLVFWFFLHLAAEPVMSHGQVRDEATGLPGDGFLIAYDGSWCEIGRLAGLPETARSAKVARGRSGRWSRRRKNGGWRMTDRGGTGSV
jgi:hypothetical protein